MQTLRIKWVRYTRSINKRIVQNNPNVFKNFVMLYFVIYVAFRYAAYLWRKNMI